MTRDSPSALPIEIEVVEEAPGRLRYRLPPRELGRSRLLGWLVLFVALVIAYSILARPLQRLVVNGAQGGNIFPLVFWSVVLFFFVAAPARFLVLLLLGHCEIELAEDRLTTIQRAGPLRRTKKWPLARVKQLQVVGLSDNEQTGTSLRQADEVVVAEHQAGDRRRHPVAARNDPFAPEVPPAKRAFLASANALTGVLDDGKRILIVAGYPRDWLTPLADDLSARCNLTHSTLTYSNLTEPQSAESDLLGSALTPEAGGRVPVQTAAPLLGLSAIAADVAEQTRKRTDPDVFEQPPGSDVQVDAFADGLTLRIPPRGPWKGSAGLFQFGIVWCLFIAAFTILAVAAGAGRGAGLFGGLAFMSLFWLIGAGLLLAGWNMGSRSAVVAVVAENVMVMQTGLRRATRREWPRSEVTTIRVGPSGMAVNDVPVPELQIHGENKKLFGMLAGRDPQELAWMATLLRQALNNTGPPTPPTD